MSTVSLTDSMRNEPLSAMDSGGDGGAPAPATDSSDASSSAPSLLERGFRLLSRYPVVFMVAFLLPSLLSIGLLFVPSGWSLKLDYTYDQFRIQGDTTTVRDEMNSALRAFSYSAYKPTQEQLQVNANAHSQPSRTWLRSDYAGIPQPNASFHLMSLAGSTPPPSASHAIFHPMASNSYIHRAYLGETLTVIYQADGKRVTNLITSAVIRRVRAIETAIVTAPGYQTHCRVYYQGAQQGECIIPNSVLNFMYPSTSGGSVVFDGRGALLVDPHQVASTMVAQGLNGFFDRSCVAGHIASGTLISTFTFGLPLPGYTDINDRLGQQRAQLRQWMAQYESVLSPYDGQYGFRVLREGGDIVAQEINAILARDLVTVGLSIALVLAYMIIHTRSLFLPLCSMAMMALAFPPVVLVYQWIFGHYMSLMNVVAVWLILGIGTDDAFIFIDTWNQFTHTEQIHATATAKPGLDVGRATAPVNERDLDFLSSRLSWSTRRAASAMLVTSFTTAAGFFSTSVSQLAPIRQFGFFLGAVVCVNYMLVITFLPAAVVAHARYAPQWNVARNPKVRAVLRMIRRTVQLPGQSRDVSDRALDFEDEGASPPVAPCDEDTMSELTTIDDRLRLRSPVFRTHSRIKADTLRQRLIDDDDSPDCVNDNNNQPDWTIPNASASASGNEPDNVPDPTSGSDRPPFRVRAMLAYSTALYRFRWLVLVLSVALVVTLACQIPDLELPRDLPQILPADSNIELLRAMKKNLACDRCVQGKLNVEANTPPATCPTAVCGDPSVFEGCDTIDCGEHGYCQRGQCHCRAGFYGAQCEEVDRCHGQDCGAHGSCNAISGQCECKDAWSGEQCDVAPVCANVYCGEHGVCDNQSGHCACLDGYTGDNCQTAPPVIPGAATNGTKLPISADLSVNVLFLFGVSGVDMHDADNENPGRPEFDPRFDLAAPASQLYLLDFCYQLGNNTRVRTEMFRCPMLTFHQWLQQEQKINDWPLTESRFLPLFVQFLARYESQLFDGDVGFETVPKRTSNGTLINTVRATFYRASVRTFLDADTSGVQLEPEFDYWESWFSALNDQAPATAQGVQTSPTWPRMKTELAFISGTLASMAIAVAIVALAILLFTGNLWLVAFTSVCILAIVCSLLGLFVVWGWPLGALESLSVPLVVGLSVDYCLHIGHAFIHSGEKLRVDRTRVSLATIGPSVFAAAITTIACLAVLLACEIVVFVKFGIIVATTLAMGLVISMATFTAMLMVAGPQHHQGDIRHLCRTLGNKLRGRGGDYSGEPTRDARTIASPAIEMRSLGSV